MSAPASGDRPPDPRRQQRLEGWTVPRDRVEAFISGAAIAVEPEQIEAELARYWKQAAERARSAQGRLVVNRATLWNLVVCVRGEGAFQRVKSTLDEVAESLPARMQVLYTHRARGSGETPTEGHSDDGAFDDSVPLRAFIEANVRDSGPLREVLGEEITLEAPYLESRRLPGMMRGLLLPDLPTALFLPGPLPAEDLPLSDTVPMLADCNRLILDSCSSGGGPGLAALARVVPTPGKGLTDITDLGWLRLAPWRSLLASLFDPLEARRSLRTLREVQVRYCQERGATRAYLLMGWLLDRLGLCVTQVAADGAVAHDAAGREVQVRVTAGEGRHSPTGIDEVAFVSDDATQRARGAGQGDTRSVELISSGAPRRVQPLHGRPDAELLIAALQAPGRDPLLLPALRKARTLIEPDPDAPGCHDAAHPE